MPSSTVTSTRKLYNSSNLDTDKTLGSDTTPSAHIDHDVDIGRPPLLAESEVILGRGPG